MMMLTHNCFVLLTLVGLLLPSSLVYAQDQRCSDFTNSHSITDFATGATGAIPYSQCNIILGDLDIICSNGVTIDSLEILRNVHTVTGDVTIQNCPDLVDVDGLRSLQTIEGSLAIINNNILETIRGLENLVSVGGSVRVYRNPVLCYIDLFKFERVGTDVAFQIVPNCLETSCDASCTCGYCGSGGQCIATCPEASLAWVAAPVVIFVILLAVLIFLIVRWSKRDDLSCDCLCTISHPVETDFYEQGELLPMRNPPYLGVSSTPRKKANTDGIHSQFTTNSLPVAKPRKVPQRVLPPPVNQPNVLSQRVPAPQAIRLPRLKTQQSKRADDINQGSNF
eukprot:m.137251 g.137251  ORF g.137251 m.137251 type:complete len:338 (-) comp11482_c0_seq1:284-1297(-)